MSTRDSITENDLVEAVEELAMLPSFPFDSRGPVMDLLRRICPHRTALRWLVRAVVDHCDRWPGPAELRAVLCSRYDAADGVDRWSNLPGFTAQEAAAKAYEQHVRITGKSSGFDDLLEHPTTSMSRQEFAERMQGARSNGGSFDADSEPMRLISAAARELKQLS